jgi:hypothetical protein
MRFGLTEELPQHPRTWDMLRFALRKLGPWLIALVITVYLSYALPPSLGKSLAMVLAYALVVGTCFSAICVIAFSLLDGPHRHRALYILRHQAFRPLWLIGSFAAFGEALSDPRLVVALGSIWPTPGDRGQCHGGAVHRAVHPALPPPDRPPDPQPAAVPAPDPPRPQRHHRNPRHLLVHAGAGAGGISLFATFVSAGDTSTALRQSLMCTVLLVVCMVINGLVRRHAPTATRHKRHALYPSACATSATPWPTCWCGWRSSSWACASGACR